MVPNSPRSAVAPGVERPGIFVSTVREAHPGTAIATVEGAYECAGLRLALGVVRAVLRLRGIGGRGRVGGRGGVGERRVHPSPESSGSTGAPESVSVWVTQHGLPLVCWPAELVSVLGQSCALVGNGLEHAPFRQYGVHDPSVQVPPAAAHSFPLEELQAVKGVKLRASSTSRRRKSGTESQRMGRNLLTLSSNG